MGLLRISTPWSSEFQETLRQLTDISLGNSGNDAKRVFSRAIEKYGFEKFTYYKLILEQNKDPVGYAISSLSDEQLKPYLQGKRYREDVHFRHMAVSTEPIAWDRAYRDLHEGRLNGVPRDLLGGLWDSGIRDGFSIPLAKTRRSLSGISLMSETFSTRDAEPEHLRRRNSELVALADFFSASHDAARHLQQGLRITPRELEVLKWSSEGYLAKQIAGKFGTSPYTVVKQSQSLQKRLAANNITEAVAKAIILGLID